MSVQNIVMNWYTVRAWITQMLYILFCRPKSGDGGGHTERDAKYGAPVVQVACAEEGERVIGSIVLQKE